MAGLSIPNNLFLVENFDTYVQEFLLEELPVSNITSSTQQIENGNFESLDLRTGVLENSAFHGCSFEKSSFQNIIFESCDFSNSSFRESYFENCQFLHCKCVGTDFCETVMKKTVFERSQFRYSCFDQSKMTDVLFQQVDLREASFSEVQLKRFTAKECQFIRNNFFHTALAGVDFTENEFAAPTVSCPPTELKGAVVSAMQAVNLAGLLGLVVKG